MAGKGDTPRPLSVGASEFAARWAATFGRDGEPLSADLIRRAADTLREAAGLRDPPPEP